MTSARPLVTVAFPLYRSGPLVETVAANIDRLTYPNLEIVISDRHGDDDAIDRLASRFRDDPRVRVLCRHDRVTWVSHYNDLLSDARGTYFCWMPHDDEFRAGYVDTLAAALDARPDAILAFGVMRAERDDLDVPVGPFTAPPIHARRPLEIENAERGPEVPADGGWSLATAFRFLYGWDLFRVVRGLVRREEVMRRGLFVPATRGTVRADVCWAFSLAVAAPFAFVPDAICTKHYRRGSASAGWHYGVREAVDECRVLTRALVRSAHPRSHVLAGTAVLGAAAAASVVWRAGRQIIGRPTARVPRAIRASVSRAVARLG